LAERCPNDGFEVLVKIPLDFFFSRNNLPTNWNGWVCHDSETNLINPFAFWLMELLAGAQEIAYTLLGWIVVCVLVNLVHVVK
jgi:hypothetical protein